MIPVPADMLRGSYPPLVTPFRDGIVDYDSFAALIEYQIREGSHGLVITGTSGEPSTLTIEERGELFKIAAKTTRDRVPVVASAGSQSHAESIELIKRAEQAAVDALLVVTPYYIRPPQRGLAEYFTDLGARTQLPLLIYHIPGRAAVSLQLDTLERIAEKTPNFVGMKHAVNDLTFATQTLDRFGFEFRLFAGLEELSFPMLAIGAAGLMNAVGNLAPRKVAELYELTAQGKLATARRLHFELFELNQAVFFDTNPIPIKYMMKRLGLLRANEHRLPMVPATPELEKRLDDVLRRAGLI
jgi:4-hydroxy-tetrahydrodipicolinate synthase